jgi:integrase
MSAQRQPQEADGLLARLMEVVRPEFRGEEFFPPLDSRVFFQGVCRLPSCERMLSYSAMQMCDRHYKRWSHAGKPELEPWVLHEDVVHQREEGILGCAVVGCRRSTVSSLQRICQRHHLIWGRKGRPDLEDWLSEVEYRPPQHGIERDCLLPECDCWTDGPGTVLCRRHYNYWYCRGHPELDGDGLVQWFRDLELRRGPHVRFHDLGRQVRFEVQFGIQQRADEGSRHTALRIVNRALTWIRQSGVRSLMDWEEDQWRDYCRVGSRGYNTLALAFIKDTRFELWRLLHAADPWADVYPRDVWDLRLVDLSSQECRHIHFGPIPLPWLKDLAKRWARWRLTRGTTPIYVDQTVQSVTRLAAHLAENEGPDARPSELDRPRIETWLAVMQTQGLSDHQRVRIISCAGAFLREIHRYDWQPDLARSAFIYDDAPHLQPPKPRFIPEHLMRQLETPEALAQFPSEDGRLLVKIIMDCGLRLKDARTLPFDCIVLDNDANPYLAWINRKIHDRPSFFPISATLAETIRAQQQAVLERFPEGCKWLFPAININIDGSKPLSDKRVRHHLKIWLERLAITDEHDRPVKVTMHQFRHTLATRMINADVPQPVIQSLLDHMSPAMTAVYAKLHDKTLRDHWERSLKINSDGQPAQIAADHPLADAAWAKMSLVRSKVTLPNGYCGAPVQTDCEYANPCLDCRFFITTSDFLQQHRRQRTETAENIEQADQKGLVRIAEKNRRTLGKLDAIITSLEATGEGQIVVGGEVKDLDAAS